MDVKDLKLKMKPVVRVEKPKKTCVVAYTFNVN